MYVNILLRTKIPIRLRPDLLLKSGQVAGLAKNCTWQALVGRRTALGKRRLGEEQHLASAGKAKNCAWQALVGRRTALGTCWLDEQLHLTSIGGRRKALGKRWLGEELR